MSTVFRELHLTRAPNMTSGCRQGLFHRPFHLVETASQAARTNTCNATPLCKGMCFSIEGKPMVSSRIISLGNPRSPAAILWAVWAIIIFAINRVWTFLRMVCGAFAHVRKELFERCSPLRTYSNSPAPIQRVAGITLLIAPGFHPLPSSICGCISHAMRTLSLGCFMDRFHTALITQTSAGFSKAFSEVFSRNNSSVTARALAQPLDSPVFALRVLFQYCQSVVSVAGLIFHGAHVDSAPVGMSRLMYDQEYTGV